MSRERRREMNEDDNDKRKLKIKSNDVWAFYFKWSYKSRNDLVILNALCDNMKRSSIKNLKRDVANASLTFIILNVFVFAFAKLASIDHRTSALIFAHFLSSLSIVIDYIQSLNSIISFCIQFLYAS